MNQSRQNYTAVRSFAVSAPQMWALLTDFGCDALYHDGMRAALAPAGENSFDGMLSIDGVVFDATYTPYDIRLTAPTLRLGLRIQPAPDGCTVMLVASSDGDTLLHVDESTLQRFLQKLTDLAQPPAAPVPKDIPAGALLQPDRDAARRHRRRTRPQRKLRVGRVILAALLVLGICAGAVLALTRIAGKPAVTPAYTPTLTTEIPGGSRSVTAANGLTLCAGMSKAEIEDILGRPCSTDNGTALYVSSAPNAYGDAAVQIRVCYESKTAQHISVLDLAAATEIGAVQGSALDGAAAAGDPAVFAAQAGCDLSLYRSYLQPDGGAVREYHFGYLDPKANFSELWQGELWAVCLPDGTVHTGKGYRYNGSDPLFCSTLQGHALSKQYGSFDEYLADFGVWQMCLDIMRIQYSRGDMDATLGGMTEYSAMDDITLHKASSACTLADGTPAWSYTAGINTRGQFALFSAVNLRLWQQPTDLAQRDLSAISAGTGLSELLQVLGMMPSCVYIDRSYLVLGFGSCNAQSTAQFEQFEFMVQLQQSDLVVTDVYNNTDMQLVIN